mmetsp:Transcript_8091/g.12397  ORF Transcript_8091/g.12397 Transcript_8091/m.12397 type:complete len:280 (-) Transcript_8091:868-1707(-)
MMLFFLLSQLPSSHQDIDISWVPFAATVALLFGCAIWRTEVKRNETRKKKGNNAADVDANNGESDLSVLPCIRNRRSVFPKQWLKDAPTLDKSIIQSLLDAAIWAPYHGRNFNAQHPAKFIILGKEAMVKMQEMTIQYYDENWKEVGKFGTQEEYTHWRKITQGEITGRWDPCSYMIAIVMRRQTGPKRLPEWEEAAAVAAATQNMHLQSTKFPQLACYWSSWHGAVRDSKEMKEFLKIEAEDKCMGFFMVGQRDKRNRTAMKDRRTREKFLMEVEWRD